MKRTPWFFRLLLRLFPAGHRRRFGEEMEAALRHRLEEGGRGPLGWIGSWSWAASDLVRHALGMWLARGRDGMRNGLGSVWSEGWGLDLRFVGRSLRRQPGYALTAVLVLAGAVAVNAGVASFVRGTLLAEAPYPDADRVVLAWGSNPRDGQLRDVVSGPNYLDLRRATGSLESLAAVHVGSAVLTRDGRPVVRDGLRVTPDFFSVLRVEPHLGRFFGAAERSSRGPASLVVSFEFWRDELGADPGVLGRRLVVDGEPRTVVGVLPESFHFLRSASLWLPLPDDLLAADARTRIHYHLVGRLRSGANPGEATRELSGVMAEIAGEHPEVRGWGILVERVQEASVLGVRSVLWSLVAAMGVVLLVALVNLVTLFRIRTLGRTGELRLRQALGAPAARVARVLGMEGAVLTGVGSALGLAATPWVLGLIRGRVPEWVYVPESALRVPVLEAVLDPWVAGAMIGTVLLAGLVLAGPALLDAVRVRTSLHPSGGWASSRGAAGTRWLVVAELALATVLCVGAGLTARSADHLLSTDVGLEPEGLLAVWVGDVGDRDATDRTAYYRRVVEAVEELPEVRSAAFIDYLPFLGEDDFAGIDILDARRERDRELREEWRRVGEGLLETAGMRILQGRPFDSDDFRGAPRSAVVNESFARKHFDDGEAVGAFLTVHGEPYEEVEVVGVVADLRTLGPGASAPPVLYVPQQGGPRGSQGLLVRTEEGREMALAARVQDAVWSVDPSQPMAGMAPMSTMVDAWVAVPRAIRLLVMGVAAFALVLAAVGVFGVVGYAVRQRTTEFGVRVALGASPERLRRSVVLEAVPWVGLGVGSGALLGVLAARAADALLYGVRPWDPWALAGALVTMVGVALLAVWLPAQQASRVDPARVIRPE